MKIPYKLLFVLFFIFFSKNISCYAGDSTGYFKMMDVVKNGNPAPDFHYISVKNDTVKLSSFLGKIVMLDLWATWCGPCKAEIPYYDTLKDKFKGKNIVFISISMDDSKQKWEEFVKNKKLTDIQVWSGGYNLPPAYYYTIMSGKIFGDVGFGSGIPVFVIIGTDGKIINNMAPRPSQKKLSEKLTKLLKKNKK